MKPAISVIIATHNYSQYLPEAIQSVIQQTFPDWELLILDDGSTDHTPTVIFPFTHDRRIRYIPSNRLGQARIKNLGIQLSKAPVIAFLDADDRWLPTKLEQQYSLMQQHPDVAVVYTRRQLIDADGAPLPTKQKYLPKGWITQHLLQRNRICFSSTMIRRSVLEHLGLFDERLQLAIDYDLWLRISNHYTFTYVNMTLVEYRTGHDNLSRRTEERLRSVLQILDRYLDRHGHQKIDPKIVRKAWGSTYHSLGYARRSTDFWGAIMAYTEAFKREGQFLRWLRGILATLVHRLIKPSIR